MLRRGATDIGLVGVYFCWVLRRGALEIGAVGVYIFGCSGGVHSKLELLECIFLGAQAGCTRNWRCWNENILALLVSARGGLRRDFAAGNLLSPCSSTLLLLILSFYCLEEVDLSKIGKKHFLFKG